MKAALAGLAGVLLAAPALAGDLFEHPRTVAHVQAVLDRAMPDAGQVQVLRGRYRQQKYLREIPRPLDSTGEFLMVRDLGLWWHTQTPRDSELTLTTRGRVQPATALLLALLVLDLEALARNFDLYVTESSPPPATHWLLGLRARDAAVAAFFQQVIVSGGERVEHVTLLEATGDRTDIALDAAPQPLSSLTPVERQRLER